MVSIKLFIIIPLIFLISVGYIVMSSSFIFDFVFFCLFVLKFDSFLIDQFLIFSKNKPLVSLLFCIVPDFF